MTLVLAVVPILPLGRHGPRLGQARSGGRGGLIAGGPRAPVDGVAICRTLAQAVAALRGAAPRLEFEAAPNPCKLPIPPVFAVRLHRLRKARG